MSSAFSKVIKLTDSDSSARPSRAVEADQPDQHGAKRQTRPTEDDQNPMGAPGSQGKTKSYRDREQATGTAHRQIAA